MNTVAYCRRGKAKCDLNIKYAPGAIEDYSKAVEINPRNGEAYRGRGYVKNQLHDLTGAIADATKAIEINPEDKMAYSLRGLSKLGLHQSDNGYEDLCKSIGINIKSTNK